MKRGVGGSLNSALSAFDSTSSYKRITGCITDLLRSVRGLPVPSENEGKLLVPLYRAPADVTPAKAVGPFDAVDGSISATLRIANGLAARANIEHAPAIGENSVAVSLGAGVEDFHTLDLAGRIEAFNERALVVVARIAFRRHHDCKRRVRIPAQVKILQRSVACGQQCRHQIRHHAQHEDLAFRIAEANIVFDQLRAILGDHQSCKEDTLVWRAGAL